MQLIAPDLFAEVSRLSIGACIIGVIVGILIWITGWWQHRFWVVSMLTAGPDECRAWPVARGTPAPRAAGKIHSDIERGFIRAEVVSCEDLLALGSEAKCREAGKLRVEGRDYVIQDGDVVNFRFNV